jgi:hypothetical protein
MVGPKYSNVVVSCLDGENQRFGDESEFQDSDGMVIGVKYIENVLLELQQIAVWVVRGSSTSSARGCHNRVYISAALSVYVGIM